MKLLNLNFFYHYSTVILCCIEYSYVLSRNQGVHQNLNQKRVRSRSATNLGSVKAHNDNIICRSGWASTERRAESVKDTAICRYAQFWLD